MNQSVSLTRTGAFAQCATTFLAFTLLLAQTIPLAAFASEPSSPAPTQDAVTPAVVASPAPAATPIETVSTATTSVANSLPVATSTASSSSEILRTPALEETTSTTSAATSTDPEEVMQEEEDPELDLGNQDAEIDALKDMTGVVRQSTPYTCGPASLATLRTQLGDTTSEQEVVNLISPENLTQASGTNMLALKTAGTKLGSHTYLKKWTADQVLAYIQTTGDPVLIHDEKKGVGGHFSVIRSYDPATSKVELSDTEAGNIKYSVEDFRHIYTGHALVISDDSANTALADTTTDISDEEAATIWGMYVPVYLAAQSATGTSLVAVATFKTCIANAMLITNYTQRNSSRAACYVKLGADLGGQFSNSLEIATHNKVFAGAAGEEQKGIGTVDILTALRTIVAPNQGIHIAASGPYALTLALWGGTLSVLPTLTAQLNSAAVTYNQASANVNLLTPSINSKQASLTTLQKEVNSGSFVNDGQTFSLGAVGGQLLAQSATYSILSANLTYKLSSLQGQITTKTNSLNSYTASRTYWAGQVTTYQSNVNYWQGQYNSAASSASYFYTKYQADVRARRSTSYNLSNYNAWVRNRDNANANLNAYRKNLSTAISNYDQYNALVAQLTGDIAQLKTQQSSANNTLNAAAAEKARLQRLRDFGDQEMARKKILLTTLTTELSKLKPQLDAASKAMKSSYAEYYALRPKYDGLMKAKGYQDSMIAAERAIDSVKARYGFTTLTYSNTAETNRLMQEEVVFEAKQDSTALGLVLKDTNTELATSWNANYAYLVSHPGEVAVVAGISVTVVGGTIFCASTLPACATLLTAMGYAGGTISAFGALNSGSIILSQKDIFGREVSSLEWSNAYAQLPLDLAGAFGSVALLQSATLAKLSATEAKALVNQLRYGSSAEKTQATARFKSIAPTQALIAIKNVPRTSLPTNVQASLSDLEKSGWVRNWQGLVNGSRYNNDGRDGTMLLPSGSNYTEWSVNKVLPQDAQRFIKSSNGDIYFTSDHYFAFVKIN